MLLSEAMRLGASWSKKGIIHIKSDDRTCALGAALEGSVGIESNWPASMEKLSKKFPYLHMQVVHPVMDNIIAGSLNCFNFKAGSLGATITILNDSYNWTREQIADWIETIEEKEGLLINNEHENTKMEVTK